MTEREFRQGVPRAPLWNDAEIGEMLDLHNDGVTAREIALILGRSRSAVLNCLHRVRNGWAPTGRSSAYTDEEDRVIRNTLNLTASQVARLLDRPIKSVTWRRGMLGLQAGRFRRDPSFVGARSLVAKSCSLCGMLLDRSWYQWSNGKWSSHCKKCHHIKYQKNQPRSFDGKEFRIAVKSRQELQNASMATATRMGEEYTNADYDVLANPNLTIFEKAVATNRSYIAVGAKVRREGYSSRGSLGDPSKGIWVIGLRDSA